MFSSNAGLVVKLEEYIDSLFWILSPTPTRGSRAEEAGPRIL
jgi:hypothetical protein